MKKLKKILYPVCAVLLLIAIWNVWKIDASTKQTKELYDKLSSQAQAGLDNKHEGNEQGTDNQENVSQQEAQKDTPSEEEAESETSLANPWLVELQEQNPELTAWLRIPGTVIDYPVMQTKEDNDFYLNHDFEGNENPHGALFLDVNCQEDSENQIIYGHHMKDGTMFQNLMLYKDPDFCQANGIIWYDTPEASTCYQVKFVMLLSDTDAQKFPYYKCIDLSDEQIYQGFLKQCSRYAIWSADSLPDTGTSLLTLSTCEYSQNDGRLVLVAAETEVGESEN